MSELNITPLFDKVIVRQDAAEDKTQGGIIIPDSAKEKPNMGIVMAAGSGTKDEPMVVKVGDKVLYGKHAGIPIEIEGIQYLIMRCGSMGDVLAVV